MELLEPSFASTTCSDHYTIGIRKQTHQPLQTSKKSGDKYRAWNTELKLFNCCTVLRGKFKTKLLKWMINRSNTFGGRKKLQLPIQCKYLSNNFPNIFKSIQKIACAHTKYVKCFIVGLSSILHMNLQAIYVSLFIHMSFFKGSKKQP